MDHKKFTGSVDPVDAPYDILSHLTVYCKFGKQLYTTYKHRLPEIVTLPYFQGIVLGAADSIKFWLVSID